MKQTQLLVLLCMVMGIHKLSAQLYPYNYFHQYICIEQNDNFRIYPEYFHITYKNESITLQEQYFTGFEKLSSEIVLGADTANIEDTYHSIVTADFNDRKKIYSFHFYAGKHIYIYIYAPSSISFYRNIFGFFRNDLVIVNDLVHLEEGTYLIDWTSETSPLNQSIYANMSLENQQMAQEIAQVSRLNFQPSYNLDSVMNKWFRTEYTQRNHQKVYQAVSQIEEKYRSNPERYLGYYQVKRLESGQTCLYISEPAIRTQKISEKGISGKDLEKYIRNPDLERPEEVKKILSVFEENKE